MRIELTPKFAGAVVIGLLGGVLALASTIARGSGSGPVNAPSLVQTMIAEKNLVTPLELARWIIEKKQNYQLVDIRAPWQFNDYHIPTAVNISLARLLQPEGLKQLSRSKKIVVYGTGSGHPAQAQLLLSLKGYNAFSLREGISAWWSDVMTPVSLLSESGPPTGYLQAKQIRDFFMGTAKEGAASRVTVPQPLPAQPAGATKPPAKKTTLKLGRGCS